MSGFVGNAFIVFMIAFGAFFLVAGTLSSLGLWRWRSFDSLSMKQWIIARDACLGFVFLCNGLSLASSRAFGPGTLAGALMTVAFVMGLGYILISIKMYLQDRRDRLSASTHTAE